MRWRKWGYFEETLYFLCELLSEVNYYSTDSNLLFVLVLISSHSWCVLPSGRPLIKPFSCRKLDNPSPHTLFLSLSLSTPSAAFPVPLGAKPFHFTSPSATLNIISAFSCSDGLSESCAQIGAFCRKWIWLVEVGCLAVTLEEWLRECNHFMSTWLTLKYLFTGCTINHCC